MVWEGEKPLVGQLLVISLLSAAVISTHGCWGYNGRRRDGRKEGKKERRAFDLSERHLLLLLLHISSPSILPSFGRARIAQLSPRQSQRERGGGTKRKIKEEKIQDIFGSEHFYFRKKTGLLSPCGRKKALLTVGGFSFEPSFSLSSFVIINVKEQGGMVWAEGEAFERLTSLT